jgi:hypothetical protein
MWLDGRAAGRIVERRGRRSTMPPSISGAGASAIRSVWVSALYNWLTTVHAPNTPGRRRLGLLVVAAIGPARYAATLGAVGLLGTRLPALWAGGASQGGVRAAPARGWRRPGRRPARPSGDAGAPPRPGR